MKKVLVITYYWPPSGGAGVQRWLKFVKYLRGFGWEPVVYTPENPEAPVTDQSLLQDIPAGLEVIKTRIWEPYLAYKRFIGQDKEVKINAGFLSESKKPKFTENIAVWIRGNFFIPDARKFWIRPSIRFLKKYLRENKVDALVSTGPPHTTHMIAMGLKKKLNIPWLADFRDPWTNIDFYQDLRLTRWADKKHHKLEAKVLNKADRVVVISPGMGQDLNQVVKRDYEVITNGYDEDDYRSDVKTKLDKKFSLTHIGTLVRTRNPQVLWQTISDLVADNQSFARSLEIKLVGKLDIEVRESLNKYGLRHYIKFIDYLPHNEINRLQGQSSVLLLIINDTPNSKMILPGKFFEYMGAGRPILCIGPVDGDAAQIIQNNHLGDTCAFEDKQRLKEILLNYYSQYVEGKLTIQSEDTILFTRRKLTAKLAQLLDELTSVIT